MNTSTADIAVLIGEEKYEEILAHPKATEEQKAVALIKLDRYKEAIDLCHNNTFEKGYCYYKLEKYKSALHTAGNKKGADWTMLRSQILYKLDRHMEALAEIKKLKLKGAILVNYAGNVAMACAENKLKSDGPEVREILEMIKNESVNIQGEVLYNLSFAYLPDRKKTLQKLKEIDTPDRTHRQLVASQIHNIEGNHQEISPSVLTKSNRAIHKYNTEGVALPNLQGSMKQFQKDSYYQNKIRRYRQTKNVPEICNIINDLEHKNTKPMIKFISKISRKNALRLEKVLKDDNLLNKSLRRIISNK
ncbi:hypothetical protein NEAUS03_1870 [Nematocida ausubeli]|nr:hypothetical protein NEAUS03_1870 [Nematocida ausubeli]